MNLGSFLSHAGYPALILLGFLEACCVPISSEVVFGFAGVLAYQGHLSLPLVIVAGTLAEIAGSYVSYGAGRFGQRPVVERLGRYVLLTKADIDRAERLLASRGSWAVPVGRTLPLVRSFTSVAAGFANMPAVRFGFLSLLGTVIYVSAVASIGYGMGSAWRRVAQAMSVSGYVIAALAAAAIVAFVLIRLQTLRREARAEPAPGPPVEPDTAADSPGGPDRN
jgi:membrane protein DedA with SNARE-associated domain